MSIYESGIEQINGLSACSGDIHEPCLLDYLPIQMDKPWYNY